MTQPEYPQQPQNKEMIDMVMLLQTNGFYDQARIIEAKIQKQEGVGSMTNEFIAKQIKKLNRRIGSEYKYMPARVLAIAQVIDECDELTGEEELIKKERDMTFMGVDSFIHEGRHRLAMRFHDIDKHEQDYLVLFADLSVLEVADPSESYGLRETFAELAAMARAQVCNPNFYDAGYHAQQEAFHKISKNVRLEIDRLCGEDGLVDISCAEYYAVGDSDDYILPQHIDQSQLSFEEQETLSGNVVDVLYIEPVLDYFKIFTDASDYIIGDGTPCLVVRPAEKEQVYLIPLSAVTGAEVDEEAF
jgi:hypothetical protein